MKPYTAGLASYRTENTAMYYTQQLAQSTEAHFPFDDVINNMWKHELFEAPEVTIAQCLERSWTRGER